TTRWNSDRAQSEHRAGYRCSLRSPHGRHPRIQAASNHSQTTAHFSDDPGVALLAADLAIRTEGSWDRANLDRGRDSCCGGKSPGLPFGVDDGTAGGPGERAIAEDRIIRHAEAD